MKSYTTKANAKRAAKSQNIDLNTIEFVELGEKMWSWREVIGEEEYTEEDAKHHEEVTGEAPETADGKDRNKSCIENPCQLVWNIADEMEGARRKDVIEACVKAGVAFYTARTQYQLWKQANNA